MDMRNHQLYNTERNRMILYLYLMEDFSVEWLHRLTSLTTDELREILLTEYEHYLASTPHDLYFRHEAETYKALQEGVTYGISSI